jgi:hypothetical protein
MPIQNIEMSFRPKTYWPEADSTKDNTEYGDAIVASIHIASTLGDDWTLLACSGENSIKYSVVDGEGTNFAVAIPESQLPLSLAELICQIDSTDHPEEVGAGGLLISHWESEYSYSFEPRDAVRFAWIKSAFYPQLDEYYQLRSRQWRLDKLLEIRRQRQDQRAKESERARRLEPFVEAINKMIRSEVETWARPKRAIESMGFGYPEVPCPEPA